jgi:hypothetical protein
MARRLALLAPASATQQLPSKRIWRAGMSLRARMLPDEMKIDTVARHISGGIRIPWQAEREVLLDCPIVEKILFRVKTDKAKSQNRVNGLIMRRSLLR